MRLAAVWTVFEFEFLGALTWRRLLFVAGLALFPASLVWLVQYQGAHLERGNEAALFLSILIPGVVCVSGLLLWATPAVHAELDAKTWAYLTVRPVGRGAILTGKYLAAVAWATLCAWLSLTLSLGVLCSEMNVVRPALGLGVGILISSAVYGALFTLLGVLFLHKAMVAAVAYTALVEVIVAFVPATINHFSVQYHLRCLLSKWILEHPLRPNHPMKTFFFSDWQPWQHVVVLLALAVGLMTAAIVVLRRRQLVTAAEA